MGELRWKVPQPVIFGDMEFRSKGTDEDCLYLNVWTPAKPVGDGSEARYDGASMAAKGIVSVTVNYRLAVFRCG